MGLGDLADLLAHQRAGVGKAAEEAYLCVQQI